MESTLVIKVKYGDTLRRFNARIDENNELDLDMVKLRSKILSLFNIPPDANFMLRYVDEDGDLVTLVDDDDLHDVMRQNLKFLRIDLHMSNDRTGKSNSMSSGSSTPLISPRALKPFVMSGNAAVADVLHSVPEPLREALSNLSLDLASKAASSSPVLATLADSISKIGQALKNSDSQPQVAAGPSFKNDGIDVSVTSGARGPQPSVDSTYTCQQVEAENVTRGVGAPVTPVDLNVLPCDPNLSQFTNVNAVPVSSAVPDGDGKKGQKATNNSLNGKGGSCGASTSHATPDNSSTQTTATGTSPFFECPFSGTYMIDSAAPAFENHRVHPFKRSHSHTEAMGGMFHKGVRCDGCGVYPITGPRFKSKVRENYDLCSICFSEMGNETDYIRMDRPVSIRAPRSFKGLYEHAPWMGSPTLPHLLRNSVLSKHARPKLDSRFILDVNVIDGTMMAPSTAFIKIWRMRNNGTIVWPKGTQLVWIGGDCLNDFQSSVNLEISEDGVPVDKELDIAVDFRAPQSPGRYISYWRMASPSGQKFGQRVWVLIQVDASLKESFYDSSQGLNLNIPLDDSGSKGPENIDINVPPIVDDVFLQPCNSNGSTKPGKQTVDEQPREELGDNIPINETTFVSHVASAPATSVAPSSVSYPIIDFSETAPVVASNPQSSVVGASLSSLGIDGDNSVEETLLKELEEMGFKQVDLNKEILRMNEYNLEQSVDDLCGVSDWDPILDELQEMGFRDNEMNKRLLKKNNGSIKRVVMDLISREKV